MRECLFIYVLLLLLFSCDKEKRVSYRENGLSVEHVYFSDNTSVAKEYYPNGHLFSIIHFVDSVAEGCAEFYFEDGTLMWRGAFNNGVMESRFYSNDEIPFVKYNVETKPECNVHVGDTVKLRVVVDGVDPRAFLVDVSENSVIKKNENDYCNYPFIVIPQESGTLCVYVHLANENDQIIRSDDKRTLKSNVLNVLP